MCCALGRVAFPSVIQDEFQRIARLDVCILPIEDGNLWCFLLE